jgi:predicted naringenin-chalcone synthase
MFIVGLGTATPARRYTQQECWEAVQHAPQFAGLSARSQALLRKVLSGKNGIVARHLSLEPLAQAFELTPEILQQRFAHHAPALAAEAARRALADAHRTAPDLDALLISTCTGYLCPGLTSYVAEALGCRPDVLALDLVGQGCGAAVPNLRAAEALLASGRAECVLSVCVEICSAALFWDDDPGVLISACLFGDGAGAAVLAAQPNGNRRIRWRMSGSRLDPSQRDLLRFEHQAGMLRNLLTPEVPSRAAAQAHQVLGDVLSRADLARDQLSGWVLHPGGRDVLTALRTRLELSQKDLRWSEAVLAEYGNLSSSSVFFVLQTALADTAPGGYWWLASFGAGFSGHGALLEVE